MTRRRDKLPDSGLLYVPAGRYDSLAPQFDFLPGLLHDGTVGILYGPPGSGKTFFALHLLCSTALGRKLFGVVPEQRNGLYVGLEGEAGIKARVAAWCAENGVDDNPIHYALGSFSIASEGERDVLDLIDHMKRQHVGFVVIDTLSLAMAGLDEISGQHMTLVIDTLHRIKRETGACVVAIAHTGKNEKAGIRGHSSQLGNVDTTIEIVCQNKETVSDGNKTRVVEHDVTLATPRYAVVRKQRDGEGGKRFHFTLKLHDTPFTDARGNTLQRPALCEHEAFTDLTDDSARPARGVDALALETLAALQKRNARLEIPVTRAAYRSALKREGWKPGNSPNADAWARGFRRLMERLQEAGMWEATP